MDEVTPLGNVQDVCRLCLTEDEPKLSIFSADVSSVSLSSKIEACLSIEVSSKDKLSTLICRSCVKNVNQWHTYKETCLKAQEKLRQWLVKQTPAHQGVSIKQEPIDLEFHVDNDEIIQESAGEEGENAERFNVRDVQMVGRDEPATEASRNEIQTRRRTRSSTVTALPPGLPKEQERSHLRGKPHCMVHIKTEPLANFENDCNLEIESVTGNNLLPNPMAIKYRGDDRVMEADSTQKTKSAASRTKKKIRRGPHTHLRMKRTFKQKCMYCQIHLHSKFSYLKHMERFHTPGKEPEKKEVKPKLSERQKQVGEKSTKPQRLQTTAVKVSRPSDDRDTEMNVFGEEDGEDEMVEDVEEEIDNMDNDSETPLSQVQQDIIGQLKTFSCYPCQQTFHDRRSTLNHLRQHMPDLRSFTCIACLTEFPDRSSYKSHCGTSFECAMKIALVEPKTGIEKYFICNMCLRPLANRKELLSHLAAHSDRQYAMLTSPKRSPPKLTPMAPIPIPPSTPTKPMKPEVSLHDSKGTNLPGPYENGNPAFNFPCDLCGMIYRYKPNMLKHRDLCEKLPPDVRTSYKCTHCGMTFLIFKKFYNHVTLDHKKREVTCVKCYASFRSPSDYLTHHEEQHKKPKAVEVTPKPIGGFVSPLKDWNAFEAEVHANQSRISGEKYSCALCGQEFPTRAELGEHRNLHLKVKIYSCVICRSMFSSAGALEVHMKDHGIEDPHEQSAHSSCVEYEGTDDTQDTNMTDVSALSEPGPFDTECRACKKVFSNTPNLKRHIKTVHTNANRNLRIQCMQCSKTFRDKSLYEYHLKTEHKPPKPSLQCPKCSKSFVFQANLNLHMQNVHSGEPGPQLECDICGKQFLEEQSMKNHKGWHVRTNCRLSVPNLEKKKRSRKSASNNTAVVIVKDAIGEKPARARKSFPNAAPAKPIPNMQCQVCDHQFTDVTDLRKHLWDVHCARTKNEKDCTPDGLQCEICTNVFQDSATLDRHMKWHKEGLILSGPPNKRTYMPRAQRSHRCEICGNFYSTPRNLQRHQKLHKATAVASIKFQSVAKKPMASQFQCNICRKVFATVTKLRKHKARHFVNPKDRKRRSVLEQTDFMCEPCLKYYSSEERLREHQAKNCPHREPGVPLVKKMKLEMQTESEDSMDMSSFTRANENGQQKKIFHCGVCKKSFLGKSLLYKHRAEVHSLIHPLIQPNVINKTEQSVGTDSGKFPCTTCGKQYASAKSYRNHYAAVHKHEKPNSCNICKAVFNNNITLTNHMRTHSNKMFKCNICERQFLERRAMMKHLYNVHLVVYHTTRDKGTLYSETEVPVVNERKFEGVSCPHCKLTFMNSRSMNVHVYHRHKSPN